MSNNIPKSPIIIGISPGTRVLGLVVWRDQELLEWKVKTVNGRWSSYKLDLMISFVEGMIVQYEAGSIVVKIFHESNISRGLHELMVALKKLAKRKSCTFYTCTIQDLKDLYKEYDVRNKVDLMHAVVSRHPELAHLKDKELKNRNPYYTKMFEAVACAHSCATKQPRL